MPSKKVKAKIKVESLITRHLNSASKTWVAMIEEYSSENFFPDDNLYWYNERATLSTFASALVKEKHYIIEEFSDKKKKTTTTEKKTGRVDLWFWHRDYGDKHCYVEAKQIWINISTVNSRKKLIEKIKPYVKKAQSRLYDIKNVEGGLRIILLFLVPRCLEAKYKDTSVESFKQSLKQLEDKPFLYTECFLDRGKYKNATTWNGYCYPGVVLLGFFFSPEKKRSPKKNL